MCVKLVSDLGFSDLKKFQSLLFIILSELELLFALVLS